MVYLVQSMIVVIFIALFIGAVWIGEAVGMKTEWAAIAFLTGFTAMEWAQRLTREDE